MWMLKASGPVADVVGLDVKRNMWGMANHSMTVAFIGEQAE